MVIYVEVVLFQQERSIKMNRVKKISSFITIILLTIAMVPPSISSAQPDSRNVSKMTMEEIDQFLLSKGATKEMLAKYPDSEKLYLVENNVDRIETCTGITEEDTQNEDEVSAQGTIKDGALDITASFAYFYTGYPTPVGVRPYVHVFSTYDWKNPPLWFLTDQWVFNWDSSLFTLKPNSWKLVNHRQSCITGEKTGDIERHTLKDLNNDSLLWDVDIKSWQGTIVRSGYTVFDLEYNTGVDPHTQYTYLISKYGHNTIMPTASISLGADIGFSLSTARTVYHKATSFSLLN